MNVVSSGSRRARRQQRCVKTVPLTAHVPIPRYLPQQHDSRRRRSVPCPDAMALLVTAWLSLLDDCGACP